MAYAEKVREHVRKFFNQETFNPRAFRDMVTLGLMGLLLAELMVYILLRHSADLGELPHNITDVLIISISLLEFLVVPLITWLGSRRRRTVLVGWTVAALLCTAPLFALPDPEITADDGLCTTAIPLAPRSSAGMSAKTVIRLSLLLLCGVVSALARAVYMAHGLAYLDENKPTENLHMHVGIFVLHRTMVYLLGGHLKTMILELTWLQILIIIVKYLITILRLFRYPDSASTLQERESGKGLFRTIGRVLGNSVAVLQILAMSSLAAAWWGFGMHESTFTQVKYYIRADDSQMAMLNSYIRLFSVFLGVFMVGYMYTSPVMPKFDRKSGVASAAKMCVVAVLAYVLMTAWLSCNRSGIGGLGQFNYSQPDCGQNCSCDRPWMKFTPVCVPEQMTTYFSPCHAGCALADTVNTVEVYSNCTCAAGGRATVGACDDGSCASMYSLHQMLYVLVALASTLAFSWQITVLLESVDKRDVAVAIGVTSAVVSFLSFAGAHTLYMGFSYSTCAYNRGSKCLHQNDLYLSWVGYSSAGLAGLSLILTIISCIVLRRQKEPKEDLSI